MTKKPALRRLIGALWLMLIVLCLPGSATAAQKNVKASDIKLIKFNDAKGTAQIKIKNKTGEKITIDTWAGCWTIGESGCDAALHLVNKKGKQLLTYVIPKKKTCTIYFKRPSEMLGSTNSSDKIIFNFKTGKRKKTCVITLDYVEDKYGYDVIKPRIKIKSGHKKIPYAVFIPEPEDEQEEEVYATYANYIKVKVGMTYKQVSDIFGFHGRQGSNINGYITYNWDGPGYTYAYIVFYGGKVVSTFQYGLD